MLMAITRQPIPQQNDSTNNAQISSVKRRGRPVPNSGKHTMSPVLEGADSSRSSSSSSESASAHEEENSSETEQQQVESEDEYDDQDDTALSNGIHAANNGHRHENATEDGPADALLRQFMTVVSEMGFSLEDARALNRAVRAGDPGVPRALLDFDSNHDRYVHTCVCVVCVCVYTYR